MQIDDPTKDLTDMDNPADLLVSCTLDFKVFYKKFEGVASNKLVFQRATNFTEMAFWNDYNKGDKPEMVVVGGATKEIDVSMAILGDAATSFAISMDITNVCKEML